MEVFSKSYLKAVVEAQGELFDDFARHYPDWIGRFYATCQWLERKSSREVFAQVPLAFLKIGYAGLHDLELDLAVRKVCGAPASFKSAKENQQ